MKKSDSRRGSTPDQAAAHEFLSELRTRISTQPLPYQYSVAARALESLWEVFAQARGAMKNNPGCVNFARRTTEMLNLDLRPMTAKWHRAYVEGRLSSRDGGNEFRDDLEQAQVTLRGFASELHEMAYGVPAADALTPPALDPQQLRVCLADLEFGIPRGELIPDETVAKINEVERKAIEKRRSLHGIGTADRLNAVGLGLSGGGIRSATFCLGVTQVLAQRELLKNVDFLSTVSGGGYVGCFLTARLGQGEPHSGVAGPHGPDPAPIRYLRQHAKYLTATSLKQRWGMVTETFAGMVLNWTAPLFLVAVAALIASSIPASMPVPWRPILLAATVVTLIALAGYALKIRSASQSAGTFLSVSTAATLLLGCFWLLTQLYAFVSHHHLSVSWQLSSAIAAAVTAFPAVVRFVPILSKPAVRNIVLKLMLVLAGLIVPMGAIALLFWFYQIGAATASDTSF
jgi:hypothetical protein